MKALILSGGTGSRLRPLTYTNAKQLLPLANKPILFYIIEKIVDAGINDIGIIVGDTGEEIKSKVGYGRKWGANITYIYQPIPLGLAHAVKTASSFIGDSDFLMILGDNIFKMNLNSLVYNFYKSKSNSSILLHKVLDPSQYGVAVVEKGQIVKLVEKPKEFVSPFIITGVYIFDKSIFNAISNTKVSKRGELEITDAIQKQLDLGGKVSYELIKGWWKDAGKLQDILEANRLILDDIRSSVNTPTNENSIYSGKLQMGKNVLIENSIITGPTTIADDVSIKNCFIGPYTCIGQGVNIVNCEIENCIILENSSLLDIDKRISNSLIGKSVLIRGAQRRPYTNSFLIGDNSEIQL
jgi:glucose-1-phosphate thymidylyltransferase